MTRIYFDHNATSNVLPEVQKEVSCLMLKTLNPSSIHYEGRESKQIIEDARRNICKLFNIDLQTRSHSLVFTSSGTEANNMLFASHSGATAIVAATEHSSVLEAAKRYAADIWILEVDHHGIVKLDQLEQLLKKAPSSCLVSVMAANNETGVIQPLDKIASLTTQYGVLFHSDCVQVPGKISIDANLSLDYITLSAHKCGGIAGTGAIISKANAPIHPLLVGGGQEKNCRAGTENVLSIAAFGKTAAWHLSYSKKNTKHINTLQTQLENTILSYNLGTKIYGFNSPYGRLCNTSMIFMPNIEAKRQLILFDLEGFAVSAGSACSSGKVGQSHVLQAMGASTQEVNCSIRVSLSHTNTIEEIEKFTSLWHKIALTA